MQWAAVASVSVASPLATTVAWNCLWPSRTVSLVPRLEGADKVTGAARYLDDLIVPGVLHGFTVRSTIPHGRITRIEMDRGFDWSGVVVADHKDIPGENQWRDRMGN